MKTASIPANQMVQAIYALDISASPRRFAVIRVIRGKAF
jgi:hypothetical protein